MLSSTVRTLDLFCIFPTLCVELNICLRRSGFFYWKMIFRNQGWSVRYSHCFCSVTDSSPLSGQSWEIYVCITKRMYDNFCNYLYTYIKIKFILTFPILIQNKSHFNLFFLLSVCNFFSSHEDLGSHYLQVIYLFNPSIHVVSELYSVYALVCSLMIFSQNDVYQAYIDQVLSSHSFSDLISYIYN